MNIKLLVAGFSLAAHLTALGQPGVKLWEFTAGGSIGSSAAVSPDGTIYFGADDRKLYALSPDGTKKWEHAVGAEIRSSPAIASNGTIYFGCEDNRLYALNPDGTRKWFFAAGGLVDTTPAIGTNEFIYFSTGGGKLYALNPAGIKQWEFNAGVTFRCAPVIAPDGTIYAGSNDKVLYALNPNGTAKWNVGFNAIVTGLALGGDGAIYVTTGSGEAKLFAIEPDGATRWAFQAGSFIFGSPAIGADGTIYFGCFDQNLYAINPNGTEKWRFATGNTIESTPAIAADGTIYFGSSDAKLYALNAGGTKAWEFAAGSTVIASPVIRADGSVCIGAFNSKFYAVAGSRELAASPWPMFRRDPHHTANAGLALPPHVSLLSPTNGAVYLPNREIAIEAAAAAFGASVTRVDMLANSALIGSLTSPPYRLAWSNGMAGVFTLRAVAVDGRGLASTSSPVTVSVETRLTVALTSPADGTDFFLPTNVTLTASVTNLDATVTNVEFFADANKLGEASGAPFTITWPNPPLGSHVLTARASDTLGGNKTSAAVNVTVHPANAVVAKNDGYATPEDAPLNVSAPGVLTNDINRNAAPAEASLVAGPSNGALNLNANGSFAFAPNANYNGPDSFTYVAYSSGVTSAPAVVQITIAAVADTPVAQTASFSLNEDAQANFSITGADADGDPLTFEIVTPPLRGNLYRGSQSGSSLTVTYVPFPDYSGADSFEFKVNDGTTDSAPATFNLTISALPDAPVSNNDAYSVARNTPLVVPADLGVLGNDYDGDGQSISANLVTTTTNGTLSLNPDGSFSYTPKTDFSGYDRFTYQASDGTQTGLTAIAYIAVGNEPWDDQFSDSSFNQVVRVLAIGPNGDIYAGGGMSRSLAFGGVARWDGRVWHPLGNPRSNGTGGPVNALAWLGNDLVAGGEFGEAGGRPARYLARWNGQVWSDLGGGVAGPVHALAVSGNTLLVGGHFIVAGDQHAQNIAAWDPSGWRPLGGGVDGDVRALAVAPNGEIYAGGTFTNAGGVAATHVAKWNGTSWSSLGPGIGGQVNALLFQGTDLYVGGSFTNAGGVAATNVARWNGSQWFAVGSGVPGDNVGALIVKGTELYAAQGFSANAPVNIYKWNGVTWTALSQSLTAQQNSRVLALTVKGNDLIAGGGFTRAGETVVDNIASWDGQNWRPLHNALLPGGTWAVAAEGANVFLGGDFTSAGGKPINRIVRWDGTNWWPLGNGASNGVNQTVYAIATTASAGVFVGGDFTQAGGLAANHVAAWDGNDWSLLGTGPTNGVNGTVRTLAIGDTGELFVGGRFASAGGFPARNIARWDGANWSALGEGIDGDVLALAVSGTDLYAGGGFFTASGLTVNNVARWDGTKWNPVGTGITTPGPSVAVYSLAVRGTELFAGSEIGTAGGQPMPYLLRWDGTTWSPIAGTLDMPGRIVTIRALQVVGNSLYVGGLFSRIDALPTLSIARWDGTAWFPLGTGVEGNDPYVNALALRGNELLVAGQFTIAGTKSSARFARWSLTNAPPIIRLLNPAPTATFTAGDDITLVADANDLDGTINKVEFYFGSTLLGTRTTTPYSLTWSNVFTGEYLVLAKATDNQGEMTTSKSIGVRVVPPTNDIPPVVNIVIPANGAVFTAGQPVTVTVDASDSDGTIRHVALYEGNNLLGTRTNTPYSFLWSNSLPGDYTLSAVAMDNLGATATSAPVSVHLQTPPVVFIAEPREGQRFTVPARIDLSADARDAEGPISRVDFLTNGVFLATANRFSSPNFYYTWTNTPLGAYALTAVAIDQFGAGTTSAPVNFMVEPPNAPPQVRILSPSAGTTFSAPTNIVVTVDASDSDGDIRQVQLYTYDNLLGALTNRPFVFVVRNLTESTYCLNARATDNRDATVTSSQVCVTVTNDPARTPKYVLVDLGTLGGLESRAYGLNNDGLVVGAAETSGRDTRAFLYTNGVMRNLGTFNTGLGDSSFALGVNNPGQIVGYAHSSSGRPHGFIVGPTNLIDLGTLGGNESIAFAINNSGQIAGRADIVGNVLRAFLYSNGSMTNLGTLGGNESEARGINDRGQVIGFSYLTNGQVHAFLYDTNQGMTDLGTLGGSISQAMDINNAGQIVGNAANADGLQRGVLFERGFVVDLGTLGGFMSRATAINEYGQIVGSADTFHTDPHAFLWHGCAMYDLNKLIAPNSNWVLLEATGINDSGQIVGVGKRGISSPETRAFLLTPAPDTPIQPSDNAPLQFRNGRFEFCFPVPIGQPFVLEASSNLQSWVPVATNYNRSGLIDFSDVQAGNHSTRFYRAVPLQ